MDSCENTYILALGQENFFVVSYKSYFMVKEI
jgi:hypothetical protein